MSCNVTLKGNFSLYVLIVQLQSETGWWKAKVGNKTGLIPYNYGGK